MAAKNSDTVAKLKRHRKKKSRTEGKSAAFVRMYEAKVGGSDSHQDISSPSSSEGEEHRTAVTKQTDRKAKKQKRKSVEDPRPATTGNAHVKESDQTQNSQRLAVSSTSPPSPTAAAPTERQISEIEAEDAFTSFYLRQLTSDFAEDLDKIRSASDFRNSSVSMLVDALKQGRACFDRQERQGIGRAIVGRGA